jgi:hypothetical protein
MASSFVTGPAHIFVGVDPQLFDLLGPAKFPVFPNTVMLPSDLVPNYPTLTAGVSMPPPTDIVNFPGTDFGNNPSHPPPSQLEDIVFDIDWRIVYLGTAEQSPSIEIRRGWLPWFDDELGTTLPADELFEGEEAWITADITRWNEDLYAFLAQVIQTRPMGGARGMQFAQDLGTSVVYEQFAYPLILQFPFSGKMLYRSLFLPAGYRFFNAILAGPDRLEPLGTAPRKLRLIWRAREVLDLDSQAMAIYDNAAPVGVIN